MCTLYKHLIGIEHFKKWPSFTFLPRAKVYCTADLRKYTPLFACYFEAKVGRGCLLEFFLTIHPHQRLSGLRAYVVCGHHAYKAMWSPHIRESLLVECEVDNISDDFPAPMLKKGMIIQPRNISLLVLPAEECRRTIAR